MKQSKSSTPWTVIGPALPLDFTADLILYDHSMVHVALPIHFNAGTSLNEHYIANETTPPNSITIKI